MSDIPKFFQTLCNRKQIYNASVEDLLFYFPPTDEGHRIITLENFDCICVGYIDGVKQCKRFRILKCQDVPLLGVHEILMDSKVIKVDSLTHFKKDILKYEDFVSFDKSTFLLLEEKEKVFRLHTIRERIQLPLFKGGYSFNSTTEKCDNFVTHIKVNHVNDEEVVNNLFICFINIYDHLEENRFSRFSIIVENVFSKIIEFLFKEKVDTVFSWLDEIEDNKLFN
jgi:hypothetical protein